MLRRLDAIQGGIMDHKPGINPTVDAEALKYVMGEMVCEAGIKTVLHCWGVDAIVADNNVRGVVVESKSGRQAILAKMVVDATGDGDVYAAAGAEYGHHKYSLGLNALIGNCDKIDKAKVQPGPKPRGLGMPTPEPSVRWVNMYGPEADGLDVMELSRLELDHRRFIWRNTQKLRATPGYEKTVLLETASQLGVRVTRLLHGVKTVTLNDRKKGTRYPDVVAVGGSWNGRNGKGNEFQVPYGALVPKNNVENVLAAGRCISTDLNSVMRVIPHCWITGQAAGVAAAVAAQDGCTARQVEVAKVQKVLKEQDVYLG